MTMARKLHIFYRMRPRVTHDLIGDTCHVLLRSDKIRSKGPKCSSGHELSTVLFNRPIAPGDRVFKADPRSVTVNDVRERIRGKRTSARQLHSDFASKVPEFRLSRRTPNNRGCRRNCDPAYEGNQVAYRHCRVRARRDGFAIQHHPPCPNGALSLGVELALHDARKRARKGLSGILPERGPGTRDRSPEKLGQFTGRQPGARPGGCGAHSKIYPTMRVLNSGSIRTTGLLFACSSDFRREQGGGFDGYHLVSLGVFAGRGRDTIRWADEESGTGYIGKISALGLGHAPLAGPQVCIHAV